MLHRIQFSSIIFHILLIVPADFSSSTATYISAEETRALATVALRRGTVPDSTVIVPLLASGTVEDTLLAVSCLLARGDSNACMPLIRPGQVWNRPGADRIEERRLILARRMQTDIYPDYLRLWNAFPDRPAGRRSLIRLIETHSPDALSIIPQWDETADSWPRDLRSHWHTAAGNEYSRTGQFDNAVSHWIAAVETGPSAWSMKSADSLLVYRDRLQFSNKELQNLAGIILGTDPEAILDVLSDRSLSPELSLIKARALLRSGRDSDGRSLLESLVANTPKVAPDALWELATWYKRKDRDDNASREYIRLVRRYPAHSSAPAALWEAAWAFERTGMYDEAADAYDELARRWPRYKKAGRALLRYGLVAWRKGDLETALTRFLTGIERARSPHSRTALAYWLGKAFFYHGRVDDAFRWWSWAAVTDSLSFYGSQASWRIDSLRRFSTSGLPGFLPSSQRRPRDIPAWVNTWETRSLQTTFDSVREELELLYSCGMIRSGSDLLFTRIYDFYSSAHELSQLLHLAERYESYRSVSLIADRLSYLYELKTGTESPFWLRRLVYPIPYPDILERIDSAVSLDYRLISALIRKESMYDRTAESHAGARGLMQILPRTANELGNGRTYRPDDLWSVEINFSLGHVYLNKMLAAFHGSLIHALAAYNAGPHNSTRWISSLNTNDLELWMECITYGETRWYIPTIIAFQRRYARLWPFLRSPLLQGLSIIE